MVKQENKIHTNVKKEMILSTEPPSPPCKVKNKNKKYKGVRMRSWGSWVSEIRAPNQKTRIWLGSYSTAEAAARAYDVALLCLKGPQANLNFPTSSTSYSSSHYLDLLDEKTILSPKSIQRVAAQAANNSSSFDLFAPSSSTSSSSSVDSSPSDHDHHHDDNDDERMQSLMGSFVENHESLMDMLPSWYDDHEGKFFFDNGALFDYSLQFNSTTTLDDYFYDDTDIPLWSFN